MNTPVNAGVGAPQAISAARLLYWSVRRELWENRSIVIAPLCAAGVVLFGFFIGLVSHASKLRASPALAAAARESAIEKPYDMVAVMILITSFLVAIFYCLDALHGERRDRTILFWKSLPVSDLTTVLSKACIPLLILPPIAFAVIVLTHLVMMLMTGAVLLMYGVSTASSGQLSFSQEWLMVAYGLFVGALWQAPIYAWMLLVSGWARRATFLWAFLPLIGIQIFEKIAFGTSYASAVLNRHFIGWLSGAFVPLGKGHMTMRPLTTLDPGAALATPDLWLGLIVAALLIAAAIRLRRYREAL